MLILEPETTKLPRRKRRSWTLEEKRRIVDESLMDSASIAEIARRHDLNANQLFTWRRQFGFELGTASDVTTILPVTITPECEMETGSGGGSQMEIVLAGGDRMIVWADVQTAALTRVLKALVRSRSQSLLASGSGWRPGILTCVAACRVLRFRFRRASSVILILGIFKSSEAVAAT